MIVLYVFSVIFIVSPFLPATRLPHWFFRTADFIRLQSIFIEILLFTLIALLAPRYTDWVLILLTGLFAAIAYQTVKVFRYSSFFPRKKPSFPDNGKVSLLAANVFQDNRQYDLFVSEIKKYDPDIVLTMESDSGWEEGLKEIEKKYPHTIKAPNEQYYGMHLYSKNEITNAKINYLIEDMVPSIHFEYKIIHDATVYFECLHPAPPSPTENETSKERDAELMIVAKKIRERNKPTVVCGDMNDVVWSRVTRLFKKMTNMIDPRIGRGFFSTYHAGYRFMRFPLDHLFHTKDLFIGRMERTKNFGSDHFGMYYEIHYKKKAPITTKTKLDEEDKELVNDIMDRMDQI
jgi:endonuclease/exonuclease/phosphatase (EEP) superfamily protein YafD